LEQAEGAEMSSVPDSHEAEFHFVRWLLRGAKIEEREAGSFHVSSGG